jgi:hypothetical protein
LFCRLFRNNRSEGYRELLILSWETGESHSIETESMFLTLQAPQYTYAYILMADCADFVITSALKVDHQTEDNDESTSLNVAA